MRIQIRIEALEMERLGKNEGCLRDRITPKLLIEYGGQGKGRAKDDPPGSDLGNLLVPLPDRD